MEILSKFDRFVRVVSNWFAKAGALLLLVSFLVSCVDVVGANLFNWPFPGVTEIVGLFQGMVIALAIALTQIYKRHISLEIIVDRLPKRIQAIINSITSLVLLGFFVLLLWQTYALGLSSQIRGDYSQTLRLPIHYFVFIMAFAFISSCLVFVLEFLNSLRAIGKK